MTKPGPRLPGSDLRTLAERLVRQHGRATPARARVLELLLAAKSAQSHAELEQRLAAQGGMDRVTLYRVLDWLVTHGLAHRIAGEDRVWRFSAVAGGHSSHEHAHFHCDTCGRTYCLEALRPVLALSLPPGYRCRAAELTLHGQCPQCSRAAPA